MKPQVIVAMFKAAAQLNVFGIGYGTISMCYGFEFKELHQAHCGITALVYGIFAVVSLFHKGH